MEKKYYFISYWWRFKSDYVYFPNNLATDKHPLEWQKIESQKKDSDSYYYLASWQEITKEQYDLYK